MTNVQQPELRRSGETATTKQRIEDADPVEAPGGAHDKSDKRPVPEGQVSPYGPGEKTAGDHS
ncbi:hypothetical protein [Catenuloplanes indicus]|uniref:Uncharacterized protein n=1 Tax=Catenuloplanes indicus TaxID=137267 RepID=A0AAE4AZP4_9ACTN|nr:hypothetical protein [Catenuloplanes indicus]MDQ0369360.1 hypothetical protein [Catenuloplanes indicus]